MHGISCQFGLSFVTEQAPGSGLLHIINSIALALSSLLLFLVEDSCLRYNCKMESNLTFYPQLILKCLHYKCCLNKMNVPFCGAKRKGDSGSSWSYSAVKRKPCECHLHSTKSL